MSETTINTGHAAELAEILQFLADWIAADREHLDTSLAEFIGSRGYHLNELPADLHRYAFLLGGNDGQAFLNEP
jgi:hypothetical protein